MNAIIKLPTLLLLAVFANASVASSLNSEARNNPEKKLNNHKSKKHQVNKVKTKQIKAKKIKAKKIKAEKKKLVRKKVKQLKKQPRSFKPLYNRHAIRHNSFNLGTLIHFGNARFRFNDGLFYKKMAHGYVPMHPPVGLRIKHLPRNHKRIFFRNTAYFLAHGIYYIAVGNDYKVVNEPYLDKPTDATAYQLGEYYPALPIDVEPVVINAQQYFKYHSIYFLPQIKEEQVQYLALKLD
ncbi:hypothetical protein J8L70_02095 [Pseudoalteromonas sp. MMG010]|uniref:DUF6515 family protein n=1 Tax=Pseudoalteromonas sp. MMG010 TaxID=2822685 RepID=UPI001B3A4F7D|nr:DUF6515 family protein [Pseudoalteromonas sp. MMG010]MBQ4832023.1 hypothetical protein [Pseudoalteromonas sp. MMG010]